MAFKNKVKVHIKNEGNGECFFCGYNKFPEILEAAHIVPEYENEDACKKEHGIMLCPNCHEAYDRKLFTTEDFISFNERKHAKLSPEAKKFAETGEWPSWVKEEPFPWET